MRRMVLAFLLLGSAAPVLAQTPAVPPPDGGSMRGGMLGRADANGDGAITRAEAIAAADARFDRLDANRDGTLSSDEVRAVRPPMAGRGGADGSPPPPPSTLPPAPAFTREESRARAMEAFARADTNGDGTVDSAELASLRPMRGPGPRGDRPRGDMPLPPPQN